MALKAGFLFVTLLVGIYAFPVEKKDMSIFFDHNDSSARIIGGTIAGRVPYMVALTAGLNIRSFMCGSSLITKQHVLTAAHCIDFMLSNDDLVGSLRAVVGTNRWGSGGTMYKFANYVKHSEFDIETIKNDIGILTTSTDVVMSDTVSVVTLNYDFVDGGAAATVTGWGRIKLGGMLSQDLLQLNSTVVDGSECVAEIAKKSIELGFPRPSIVDPSIEICTLHSIGHGVCNGDSGSPVMRVDLNEQIGIAVWVLPCALGVPDISVRVSAYRSWIEENTQ